MMQYNNGGLKMQELVVLTNDELYGVEAGGIWGKIGGTLITVGGVIATGVNPVSVTIGVITLGTIWIG